MKGEETMKKALSLALTLVILVSVLCFIPVEASSNTLISTYEDAKDGDLLYELKFGETTGVYTSKMFHSSDRQDLNPDEIVSVLDGGRTLALYKPSLDDGSLWYGDNIDGLTLGDGKVYTITMELMLPDRRGGVYFNFPTAEKLEELEKKYPTKPPQEHMVQVPTPQFEYPYSHMYGIYGRFSEYGDLSAKRGIKRINGKYKFNENGNAEYDPIIVEEGTFRKVALLVSETSCHVYIGPNGPSCGSYTYIDSFDLNIENGYNDLGFTVEMYFVEENKPVIVKNVNIYKGNGYIIGKYHAPSYAEYMWSDCLICRNKSQNTTVPVTTTKPVVTTPTPTVTTSAAETTTVTPETTVSPETTTAPPDNKNGCASAVTSGLALIALVSLACVITAKKRR